MPNKEADQLLSSGLDDEKKEVKVNENFFARHGTLRTIGQIVISVSCGLAFYIFFDTFLSPELEGWVIFTLSGGMIVVFVVTALGGKG